MKVFHFSCSWSAMWRYWSGLWKTKCDLIGQLLQAGCVCNFKRNWKTGVNKNVLYKTKWWIMVLWYTQEWLHAVFKPLKHLLKHPASCKKKLKKVMNKQVNCNSAYQWGLPHVSLFLFSILYGQQDNWKTVWVNKKIYHCMTRNHL